jgi:hypothetical protein
VAILERRFHKIDSGHSDRDPSELFTARLTHHISGYKPISDRIDESRRRKERFIEEVQIDQEEKFREEHTFRPQINPESKQINYSRNNLFRKRKANQSPMETKPPNVINPKSKEIAMRLEQKGIDFLTRQYRPQKRAQSVERLGSARKLTKIEAETISERLSKPRPTPAPPNPPAATPIRKRADPKSFERLASQSLRKSAVPPTVPLKYESKMDQRSRQLTRDVELDLFQESLEVHKRQRQRAEEIKQWQELAEVTTLAYQPPTRKEYVLTPQKRVIAGVDEFLERMTKKPTPKPEIVERPKAAIIAQPFSFETRPHKTHQRIAEDVESVLSEIHQLLSG